MQRPRRPPRRTQPRAARGVRPPDRSRRRSCAGWERGAGRAAARRTSISSMSPGARFARGSFREVVPVHRLAYSFGWDGSEVVPPGRVSTGRGSTLIEQRGRNAARVHAQWPRPNAERCKPATRKWLRPTTPGRLGPGCCRDATPRPWTPSAAAPGRGDRFPLAISLWHFVNPRVRDSRSTPWPARRRAATAARRTVTDRRCAGDGRPAGRPYGDAFAQAEVDIVVRRGDRLGAGAAYDPGMDLARAPRLAGGRGRRLARP